MGKEIEHLLAEGNCGIMEKLAQYFPDLTPTQRRQFSQLQGLYAEWNAKINVVSRKDIGNLSEHHILHSLAIAKAISFKPGTDILDFGTGGGFPGIPLAIFFPECIFTLIDGTGKKILVAAEVAKAAGLTNVTAIHRRGEDERGKYDFVVSRAVMPLPDLYKAVRKNISRNHRNAQMNGIITLKGGNIENETRPFRKVAEVTAISSFFREEWFKQKYVIYLPC